LRTSRSTSASERRFLKRDCRPRRDAVGWCDSVLLAETVHSILGFVTVVTVSAKLRQLLTRAEQQALPVLYDWTLISLLRKHYSFLHSRSPRCERLTSEHRD